MVGSKCGWFEKIFLKNRFMAKGEAPRREGERG